MGIRQRKARKNASTHGVRNFFVGLLGILAVLTLALVVSLGTLVASWLEDLPDYENADAYLAAEPTEVYDAAGNKIASFYLENRRSVEMDQISDYVIKGTVDTEDVRFYQHNGVDPQGIVRAVFSNLSGGSEGASTITQQLVRNTILSDERYDQTLKRKVREAYIAIEMEKTYTKEQILLMYLNTIYYGHGAYGIEVASETYFNKSAADLTLAEAALLIGLPQSPSYYDPTVNPEEAVKRRNTVLDRMLTAGDITQEEHDAAQAEELQLNLGNTSDDAEGTYPYWTDYIKSLLQEDFSSDTIFKGGLKVYTTIDPACQQAAEEAVNEQLAAIGDSELNCALVAIDPDTGYIKAMVGGRDYNTSQYNLATQAQRQPGSSFKAFTLTAAIGDGMNPNVTLNCNSPMTITNSWTVQNHGNSSYGTITLARATELSSNTGYAQVATAIGADKIVSAAKACGIDEDLPAYPSLTLGTVGVPPIQMAEGYATLASGGVHRDPCAITKIEDRNGNTVYEHEDNPTQAIDSAVASAVTQVLEGVCTSGTASAIASYNSTGQPVAGKTGTTEDARDLWFCGYTPQLSVAIWTGYIEERKIYIWGSEGTPANSSVAVFYRFINKALAGSEVESFPTAATPTYKSNSTWSFAVSSATSYTSQEQTQQETTTTETTPTQTTPTQTTPTDNPGGGTDSGGTSGGGDSGGGDAGGGDSGGGDSGGETTG